MIREHTLTAPATNFATQETSALPVWPSTAMILGGASWIVYYSMWIVSGVTTGEAPAFSTPFGLFVTILFLAALLGINSGLTGLGLELRKRSKGFGYAGLAFGVIALTCSLVSLLMVVLGVNQVPGFLGGFGVMGSCISATLLAIAALRSKAMPRSKALLFLAVGMFTFPLIITINMMLPTLPTWMVDELPFAVSGATWIIFGAMLKRD